MRRIFFGIALAMMVGGVGFGQVAAAPAVIAPSTLSAVSQGGAGLLCPDQKEGRQDRDDQPLPQGMEQGPAKRRHSAIGKQLVD